MFGTVPHRPPPPFNGGFMVIIMGSGFRSFSGSFSGCVKSEADGAKVGCSSGAS